MRDDVSDNSVVLRYGDGEYTYPVVDSTVGDKGFDIGEAARPDRSGDPGQRLRQHRRVQIRDHLSRR